MNNYVHRHIKHEDEIAKGILFRSEEKMSAELRQSKETMTKRILMLHGMFCPPWAYQQRSMVQFLDSLKKANWEVAWILSPRPCPGEPPSVKILEGVKPEENREWVNSHTRDDGTKEYKGLHESLRFLQSYLKVQPRFDVIAGHSNGALMASILAFYMENNIPLEDDQESFLPQEKQCKGILCISAPNSYDTEVTLGPLVQKFGPISKIRSVHIEGGEKDWTSEGAKKMQQVHHPETTAKMLHHSEGHLYMPSDPIFCKEICEALEELLK